MATIAVTLRQNRWLLGSLAFAGKTVPCLAISDNGYAAEEGNPTRDPLKPGGDLPTGTYRCQIVPPGDPVHSYGPGRRLLLQGIEGDALKAMAVRSGLMVHGGDLNPAYKQWGGLRPTHGCLRLADEDVAWLVGLLDGVDDVEMVVSEAA